MDNKPGNKDKMIPLQVLLLFATAILSATCVEQPRSVHRLIGGHFRIFHEDPHDTDLLIASASGSKDKPKKSEDEEKKTLSQQVADGKYGLIQKELFAKPSKRPGVISYADNPEVPRDNINNLGGLTKNDIWLAENHLLVLKGGTYPPHDDRDNGAGLWPPIDDYKAPLRQVKLPAHPKVPPPFPVQLTDDGPLQILGTNASRTFNGTLEQAAYGLPPFEAGVPPFFGEPPYGYIPSNASAGKAPQPLPPNVAGDYRPFLPLNGTLPPFFASLPPGAAVLPPTTSQTEFDEDDPSIYYPPPYSFYYPKDNSSVVPAGPLVPGIVLPPPPNFFGPLEVQTTRRPTTRTRIIPTKPSTTVPPKKPHLVVPPHVINNEFTTQPPRYVTKVPPYSFNEVTTPIPQRHTTKVQSYAFNEVTTAVPQPRRTKPPVTILRPVYQPPVYGPPRVKTVVSTTQVPLKAYYSTNEIDTNSIITRKPKTTTNKSQYYYYEEPKRTTPKPNGYYQRPYVYVTQKPRYRFIQQQQPPKSDSYSIHIARLQNQIHQYYTTPRHQPKPVYQFSFQASNYQHQNQNLDNKFRPLPKYSVQIQPAIEIVPTQPPREYYRSTERPQYFTRASTSRPVSQYSFESAPNSNYQNYDDSNGYYDDNTKQYFTSFGQKLVPSTTPVPHQSLHGDTAVNYLPPRQPLNPHAEFLPQPAKQQQREVVPAEDRPGSFISYQLPGDDGAHFYFLTPQLAQSRDQGAGYFYSQPGVPARIRRDKVT